MIVDQKCREQIWPDQEATKWREPLPLATRAFSFETLLYDQKETRENAGSIVPEKGQDILKALERIPSRKKDAFAYTFQEQNIVSWFCFGGTMIVLPGEKK